MLNQDLLGRFFLFTLQDSFLCSFIFIALIGLRSKRVAEATLLLLFSIVFNSLLKCIFKVPLPPALNITDWYAFPSGHMQSAAMFYGWLAYRYNEKWLWIVTTILLLGIGWALQHFGYHDLRDVIASVIVAVTIFALLIITDQKFSWLNYKSLSLVLTCCAIPQLPMIFWLDAKIMPHTMMALYLLVGLTLLSHKLYLKRTVLTEVLTSILIAISVIVLIRLISWDTEIIFSKQLYWLFIGITIPGAIIISQKIHRTS